MPVVALATEPGDVIAFNIRTFHASGGGGNNSHRR
jgi:ectoine hydroxylase-related dioxygenase (phytanoyl-CoA dioxygenase family)